MTTKYTEFLTAYDANRSWINNVNMLCKLVTDGYTPDPSHTFLGDQAGAYEVFNVGSAIKGNEFVTKTMGELLDLVKGRIKEKVDTEPQEVIDGINGSDISDEKKQELISLMGGEFDLFWNRLLTDLVKYLVLESMNKKVYCFCEDVGINIE